MLLLLLCGTRWDYPFTFPIMISNRPAPSNWSKHCEIRRLGDRSVTDDATQHVADDLAPQPPQYADHHYQRPPQNISTGPPERVVEDALTFRRHSASGHAHWRRRRFCSAAHAGAISGHGIAHSEIPEGCARQAEGVHRRAFDGNLLITFHKFYMNHDNK